MSPPDSIFAYEDEKEARLLAKTKRNPWFPVGYAAFTGIVIYGFWGIKNRKIPISMYLMQLRVVSQGFFVGILALGMTIQLGKNIYKKTLGKETETQPNS